MSRMRGFISLVVVGALLALVAGCSESDPAEAETPTDATTLANTAPQTDDEGNTVPAPGAEEPPPAEGEEGEGEGGAGGEAVAAGEMAFAATCSGCHLNDGQDAGGIGPQLAGMGLDAPYIEDTVVNGRAGGAMPAGLVSGPDLENVVAYVLSIQ